MVPAMWPFYGCVSSNIAGGCCGNCMWTEKGCSWKDMPSSDPAFIGRCVWDLGKPGLGVHFEQWKWGPRVVPNIEHEIRSQEAAYASVKKQAVADARRKARRKALRDAKKKMGGGVEGKGICNPSCYHPGGFPRGISTTSSCRLLCGVSLWSDMSALPGASWGTSSSSGYSAVTTSGSSSSLGS